MSEAPYPPRSGKGIGKMPPLPDKMIAQDGTVFNPNAPALKKPPTPDKRPHTLDKQVKRDLEERPWAAKHDVLTVVVDSFDVRDELRPPPGENAALDASTRTHEEDDPQCEHRQTVERHPSGGKINVRCYLDKAHSGLHHAWTPSQREITW